MRLPGTIGANRRPQTLRAATRALLCLLLLVFGSTVQAAHTHGNLLPSSHAQTSAYTGSQAFLSEDLCPLCAAMHGALAAPAVPVLHVEVVRTDNLPEVARPAHTQLWRFELFGRPPPSLL